MDTCAGASNRDLCLEAGSCSALHEMFPIDLVNLKCLKARGKTTNNPRDATYSVSLAVYLLKRELCAGGE